MKPEAILFGHGAPGPDYARAPFPYLARLHDEAPRHYVAERDAWFISRHADIVALLRDDRLAITGSSSFVDQSPEFRGAVVRRLREWFASPAPEIARAVAAVTAHCEARLAANTEVDLVGAVAHFLPSRVMAELLGIPPADVPPLQQVAGTLLHAYDLDWAARPEPTAASSALPAYFQAHWRTAPGTPLMRLLRSAQSDHGVADASMIDTCVKLFAAGTTTTGGCIANILARMVGAVEGAAPGAPAGSVSVEDLLRRETPILAVKRLVRELVQLGDATLAPGQTAFLLVASANRAPAAANHRKTPSLTFGQGRFHCLGANLARLEVSAALALITPRLSRMRLAAPIAWREAWLLHEARSIRVTIDQERHAD